MADERAKPDANRAKGGVVAGVTNDASLDIVQFRVDPTTKRLLVDTFTASIDGPAEPTIDSYTQFAINLGTGANQVLVSSAANKQIWVYSVFLTLSVDGTISFQDEDDLAITGILDHAANSGPAMPPSGNFSMPIWKLATNKDLEVDVTLANIDGWLDYALVSV